MQISLIRNPIHSGFLFIKFFIRKLPKLLQYLKILLILIFISGLIHFATKIQSTFQHQIIQIQSFLLFAFYWIFLGIASSIGLGTGLHTFVLYLGPHIAKLVFASHNCGYVPNHLPSRWAHQYYQQCQKSQIEPNFVDILFKVQLQAFFWGLGTALGQLPPYYMALAHSQQDEQNQIKQMECLLRKERLSIIQKIKVQIMKHLKKHGFITVLCLASIPNPLFDLAGILCGHFQMTFKIFFLATLIGKAIIKVHLQVIFIIFIFGKKFKEFQIIFFQYFPNLKSIIQTALEKHKQQLFRPVVDNNKSLIGRIWQWMILLMISYFAISLIKIAIKNQAIHELKQKLQ